MTAAASVAIVAVAATTAMVSTLQSNPRIKYAVPARARRS